MMCVKNKLYKRKVTAREIEAEHDREAEKLEGYLKKLGYV